MLSDARRKIIKEIALRDGEVIISKASAELGVSLETIRRDINILCDAGVLEKVHGGAVPLVGNVYESKYSERKATNESVKKKLGLYIADMIKESKTIFLSAGTTVESVANFNNFGETVSIITNSVSIAETLGSIMPENRKVNVVLLGGKFNPEEHFTYGASVVSAIKKYHADVVVISAVGIDSKGAMCATSEEGMIIAEMIKASSKVILVADSAKFGKKSVYRHCPLDDVDLVVTDSENPIPEKIIKSIQKRNIEIKII